MTSARSRRAWGAICLTVFACAAAPARGADPNGAPATQPALVELNFPENLSLKVLIDYVGKRQGINLLYDEAVVSQHKITIRAAQKVPVDSLMAVLESTLAMKGLMMTATEAGLIRIEAARPLTASAAGLGAGAVEANSPAAAMTRVFDLQHATPQQAEAAIKPFLGTPTANVMTLPGHRVLIVTDYARNMPRLKEVVSVIDRPRQKAVIRFVPVEHVEAAQLEQRVGQLLARKTQVSGDPATGGAGVIADARANQLAVVGASEEDVDQAIALIRSLDVPTGMETRTYTFQFAQAERVDRLVKDLIGEIAAKRSYRSVIDHETNLLMAAATPGIHVQIETVRQMLDKTVAEPENPIRFYKLENAKAIAVLETLRNIEGTTGIRNTKVDGASATSQPSDGIVMKGPTEAQVNPRGLRGGDGNGASGNLSKFAELPNGRLLADEATNSIIVVAKPAMHSVYERLIKRLDVRRPQVQIEATVVTIDTTDGFSLGVEILRNDKFHDGKGNTLNFSSFGLSTVDVDAAKLALRPGVGFNGTLVSSDIANVVIRALESDSRVRVVSRPSVLIDDNAQGKLSSENEAPFLSQNVSVPVSSTSFGGYAKAGVDITVRPQISEGDHLKLEYDITLSSFGEGGSTTLPPPRQSNHLSSEATTIPDGYTVVVGGLTRETHNRTVDRVPGLGRIPGLEYLFSNREVTAQKQTLFVFLRAVILRDDKFAGLKVLSRNAVRAAGIPEDCPASEPIEIR